MVWSRGTETLAYMNIGNRLDTQTINNRLARNGCGAILHENAYEYFGLMADYDSFIPCQKDGAYWVPGSQPDNRTFVTADRVMVVDRL